MTSQYEHKTKPELKKRIEELEQRLSLLELFLDNKGLLPEANDYVEDRIFNMEELPFN